MVVSKAKPLLRNCETYSKKKMDVSFFIVVLFLFHASLIGAILFFIY